MRIYIQKSSGLVIFHCQQYSILKIFPLLKLFKCNCLNNFRALLKLSSFVEKLPSLELFCGPIYWTVFLLASMSSISAIEDQKVMEAVYRLEAEHAKFSDEIEHLKKLLGFFPKIDDLELIDSDEEEDQKIIPTLKEAQKAFEQENFNEAKKLYQKAWEKTPSSYVANYNLALSSYRMGNIPFAKTIFKTALSLKKDVPAAPELKAFIEGKGPTVVSKEEKAQQALRNELMNLSQKAQTYSLSNSLTKQEKMRHVLLVVEEMLLLLKDNKELIKEFFSRLCDAYASFELYGRAREVLMMYEDCMKGELLADDYYEKKIKIEEQLSKRDERLASYRNHVMADDIKYKLSRDLHELEIFSAQIEEFVQRAEKGDENFDVICQRLGEYRWGNREGRHVIIVNRFQELLYSSLEGTVAIDRYRDRLGRSFLKDISYFASETSLSSIEKASFFPVDLSIQGKTVAYIVMFSYIPKHKAFIIVRLPRTDLS